MADTYAFDHAVETLKGPEEDDPDPYSTAMQLIVSGLCRGLRNMGRMNDFEAECLKAVRDAVWQWDSLAWESIEQEVKIGPVTIRKEDPE